MSGLDLDQLRVTLIRPCLTDCGLWSQSAENLILGIGLVETNWSYIKQIGNVTGGGLGCLQMQKLTHDDLVGYICSHKERATAILKSCNMEEWTSDALIYNLRYMVLMTRMFFYRMPEPLPAPNDAEGFCELHKSAYNSRLGKTDVSKSILLFQGVCK